MEFVKAREKDMSAIIPIMKEAVEFMNASGNFQWDKHYPTPQVFERDIDKGHLYLAKNENKIRGLVCLNFDQPTEYLTLDWTTPQNSLVMHRMIVAQEYYGKGVAKFMFQQSEKVAKRLNLTSIRSDTNCANKAMNHLFNAFNYRLKGTIVLRNNPDHFNCYEKQLKY